MTAKVQTPKSRSSSESNSPLYAAGRKYAGQIERAKAAGERKQSALTRIAAASNRSTISR